MSRRLSRESLFKLIYAYLISKKEYDFIDDSIGFSQDSRLDFQVLKKNYDSVISNLKEIIGVIDNSLIRYRLDRIYKVDLAIMINAVYEIHYSNSDKLKPAIPINEAVELAKKFSTEKSHVFINGVLASISKNI